MVVVKNLPTNSINSLSNTGGEILYDSTINHPVINNNAGFKKFVLSDLNNDVTIGRNLTVTGPILAIPTGNTAGRPSSPDVGYIRYNSQTSQFEGFGAGNAWGSLGGVNDVNQDTKILAEDGAGTNDDNLRFFNNGSENMRLTATGTLGIGTTTPDKKVEINSSSGDCLRLTYDDADGSASNYVDLLVSSGGDLSITPSGNNLDITTHDGSTQGLKLGGVLLTATATQLNNIVSGTGSSSFSNATVTGDLTISNHDGGTAGLVLGNTLVTSTATELNYLDTTPGTAQASKALVLDSSRNITNINNFNTTKLTTDGNTYSELLTSWTPQTSIANNTWKTFAYSPSLGIYVAISNNSANTSSFASSPDGLTWTTRTAPQARVWNDVIWVEDFSWFVAVSNATSNTFNSFAYSTNGTTWTGVNAPSNKNFTNILYNKYQRLFLVGSIDSTTEFSYRSNLFTSSWTVSKSTFAFPAAPLFYVSQLGKYVIMRDGNTSTTVSTLWFEFGSSWNPTWQEFADRSWSNLPISTTVKTYKNAVNSPELGIIVAVATDVSSAVDSIAYSTNLTTWTYGNAAEAGSWFKIIWAAELGLFVSISSDSTPKIMTSANGINWSLVTYSGSLTALSDIEWVPELSSFFLVSSVSGSTYAISSSSMLSSTNITFIKNPQNSNLKSSITGGAFVNLNAGLAGSFRWMNMPTSTTLSNEIMRLSTTGLSINSQQSSAAALDIKSVALNNNKVLRLRSSNGTYAYDFSLDTSGNLTTTHSANFTTSITMDHPVKIGNSAFVNSTASNTGQLVVYGGMGVQGRIYTGDTMYPASLNIQDSYLYATLGNAFYNVDELSSTYGLTGGTVPARSINNFAWSPQLKLFVCTTSSNGVFLYSSDGLAWSTASTALNRTWDGICWADKLGLFVAIANDTGSNTGMIATSANGISWSAQNGPSTPGTNWTSITWSPTLNLLVACANAGSQTGGIMYSSNGTSWTLATIPSTNQTTSKFKKIIWNSTLNQFVACGYGQFAVSSDGITWNLYNTSTATQQFAAVEYSPLLGLYVASHDTTTSLGASSTDGITWTTTNIPPFVDILWIPRTRSFIGTSGYGYVSYDNWSTNGTTWNTLQRSLQNGGYYNWKLGYSPDLEMVVIGRIGNTGANQNIIMSKTLSYTNLSIGRNYAYSRDNRTSIKMDTHLIYTSGFNGGHRWYNSLVNNQQNGQNLLMALDTDGLAIGRTIPQAKLDIQIPSAGEIIRFRTSEYNTASFGIDANARITMSHSTLTSPYTSSSDYGFIIQNNNTAGTNVSSGLLFKYKNSAGNYFNASGILPYGITNTANSETTGIRFYNTLSGSYFNSFSLLATGGCNTSRPSGGTIHSFSIGSGGDGSYGDLAIEGNSSTWLRLRTTYQSTDNLAKLDFINRYNGSDTTSFTLTPTGSNGGNITNVNNITINGGINNLATGTYNDFGNTRFNYASIFGRQWRVYSTNSLMYVRYSNTGISSNTFSQPDNYCAEFGNGDFSSLAQFTSGCFELEGFITTDYTETYTFTFESTYTKFRIWLNGKLVAQDWSANASTSPTTTFNATAGKKVSFYAQIAAGDLSTSSNNTFVLKWQSASRSYQTIPASKMEGTFTGRMVNRTPYSVANQLTLYNTTSNSSSSNKSEFLVDSSGNTLIKSSGTLVSIDSSNSLDIASHDGSSVGLKLGGSLVTSTATELNYLDTTPGTAEASKALVLDSNLDIVGIHNIETDNLTVNGTLVTSSAVELNYVDVTTIGVAQASKALVLDENLEIVGIHNIETDNLTVNGTLVTSSAIELNYVDVASIGVAEASKALVVDSNRDITNINQLATTGLLSTLIANDNASNINYQTWTNDLATDMVTALQMSNVGLDFGTTSNHPLALTTNNVERVSIDTSGNVDLINHDGSSVGLTLGGTLVTATATELNYVDTTVGAAEASKALVLDSSRNITNINEFATTGLLSTIIANDNISNINYQTWTNDLATDMITSLQMNNVGLNFGTISNHPIALTTNNVERISIDTSGNVDLLNHDGSSVGLKLDGTLVTATATELNYVDTTVGTAEANKALVLDSSRNITNINEFATTGLLSTVIANDNASNINYQTWTNDLVTDMITALQMNNVGLDFGTTSNHPLALTTNNIERVSLDTYGNVDIIFHDGSTVGLTLGGTLVTSTATELNYVDTTVGAAEASKALVLDSSRNITNINEFATTGLLSTVIANDNASNINYQTWTNDLVTDMITALQMNNVGLDFGTTSNHPLALTTNNIERVSIDTSGNVDLINHDGSTVGLTLGGTLVTATATELNYVDTTVGAAEASKALVLDSSRNITNINEFATTGLLSTVIANDNISNINYQTWTNDLATDMITALQMNNVGLDFGTTSNHPLALTTNNVERLTIDTSGNVDLINHDGSTVGLTLGGTLVTATATELNYVDTTVGAAEASKALVLDSSRNITNINEFATTGLLSTVIANNNASNINYQTWTNNLSNDIVTALQMNNVGLSFGTTTEHSLKLITENTARVSIDALGNVDLINHDGSSVGLTLGGTLVTATATELNYVDTTVGAAEASKALILDSSRNITNINDFATTGLLSTVIANDNASNINYQTWTNDLATDMVTSLQMNNVGLDFGTTSNHPLALTTNNVERVSIDTSGNVDLINHDGSSVGLTLGGTLVTATATELNYVDTTVGAAEASKALILDSSRNITNINDFATTGLLSTVIANDNASNINYQTWTNDLATDMVTSLQMSNVGLDFGTTSNHPLALTTNNVERVSIDTSGNVDLINHNGSSVGLTLGGTLVTATATELNYVDTTQGAAEASKALVLDSSRDIAGINNLYANILNATIVNETGNSMSYPITVNRSTSSTPANGLGCGIAFYIQNSNDQSPAYGSIEVSADDITDNSEDGKFKINLITGGINATALTLTKESLLVEEVVETSDRRVKENIVSADIKDSYEKIMALHLVNFNFIHDTNKRVHRGVIAQEVNEIIPSAVHINENENLDDFHSISTKELVGYMIGSLQHMNQKYNELEKKYDELEKKYNELEK